MLTEKLAQMSDSIAVGALTIAVRDALPGTSSDGSAEQTAEQRYQATPFTLDGSVVRGKLASALIDGLLKAPPGRLTYRQWLDAAKPDTNSDDPFLVNGDILDEPLFESVSLRREVLDQARSIEEAPLDELIASLLRVIEQRQKLGDTYPRGRLDLGIAYSVKGDFPNAIELLDRAVALYSDFTIMTQERARDPLADAWFHEARFQLGRVLYKSSRGSGTCGQRTRTGPQGGSGQSGRTLLLRAGNSSDGRTRDIDGSTKGIEALSGKRCAAWPRR